MGGTSEERPSGWRPPPRPDWVVAVNRGEVPPIAEVAALPLRRDDLLAEARAHLGLDRDAGVGAIDGDEGFLEPLDVALAALEEEADLSVLGRWATRRFLVRLLEGRYQLAAYVRDDPGVRDEVIEAPLVVTGAPRTGTTVLYGLLALDPDLRAPEGWELLRPVPPPRPEAFPDPARVTLADHELRLMATVSANLDAIHEYGGRMPKECLSAMSFTFLTEELTARYHVPSYASHLAAADMTPAYEMHRLVLQVLQRRMGGRRWLLKSPVHLHSLPTLLATYPDARLAVTHRDPLAVLPSVTSLVATLRWAHSDTVDFTEVGRYHRDLYGRALDRLVDADQRLLDPARTVHSRHDDFVADPLAAVERVYDHLGIELVPSVRAAMVAQLEARPRGAHGEHTYSFADLGLDEGAVRSDFARYVSHFDLRSEAPR